MKNNRQEHNRQEHNRQEHNRQEHKRQEHIPQSWRNTHQNSSVENNYESSDENNYESSDDEDVRVITEMNTIQNKNIEIPKYENDLDELISDELTELAEEEKQCIKQRIPPFGNHPQSGIKQKLNQKG